MISWFLMVISLLIIPITMIGVGRFYGAKTSGKVNHFVGYRTSRSMKNDETWKFAHKYFSKLWFKWGLLLIPFSIIPMIFVIDKDEDAAGTLCSVICVLQIAPVLVSIALTEKALKDNFDEEGNRKN